MYFIILLIYINIIYYWNDYVGTGLIEIQHIKLINESRKDSFYLLVQILV